ncbi:hypothetical protein K749_02320 [Helicobacter pylori UM299]|uniref:hypothetical protein n=1 Tax=Helicobacter pylori TaxID=210 RepID=UPI00032A27E0|nr:hypothetical protein [Helicobacter pylori]AGL67315.1 hypothetical protein K747_07700 [Helicobacter pylori UM032]AGL67853.1 hypothetical protein K749_02320 [Helicobacter pylori UM299]AGR63212.1 hypothetical protein K748_00780 [Helicobacter pylori UM298]
MWSEKILKIIPAVVFLFCLLEIFELVLTIGHIGKIEKLEAKIINNLKVSEDIAILLNEHLEGMDLKHFKDKKIKIK